MRTDVLEALQKEREGRGQTSPLLHIHKVNLTDDAQVEDLLQDIGSSISAHVCVAGILQDRPVAECSVQDIRLTLEINSIAPMKMANYLVIHHSKTLKRVVLVSSTNGMNTWMHIGAYDAPKGALERYSDALQGNLRLFPLSSR